MFSGVQKRYQLKNKITIFFKITEKDTALPLPYLTFLVDVTRRHTIQRQGHQVGPLRFPDKLEAKEIS